MSNDLLGKLIEGEETRDAIHVALCPAVAEIALQPGQHVSSDGRPLTLGNAKPVGIVDPFLTSRVQPGEKFWIVLYPNTITSLKHVWEHPAFDEQVAEAPLPKNKESIAWLEGFAAEVGVSYETLISAAEDFEKNGRLHCLNYDTLDVVWEKSAEMWKHLRNVVDFEITDSDNTDTFFRCAC